MRFRNLQFSSVDTDRKVLAWLSLILMVCLWVFLVFMLVASVGRMRAHGVDTAAQAGWTLCIAVLVVVLVPIQLVRYIRQVRK